MSKLNLYADSLIPHKVKERMTEKQVEELNDMDYKAGLWFIAKWSYLILTVILLVIALVKDSNVTLLAVAAILALYLIAKYKEREWIEQQNEYILLVQIDYALEELRRKKTAKKEEVIKSYEEFYARKSRDETRKED